MSVGEKLGNTLRCAVFVRQPGVVEQYLEGRTPDDRPRHLRVVGVSRYGPRSCGATAAEPLRHGEFDVRVAA
jgi:hypothetical protein